MKRLLGSLLLSLMVLVLALSGCSGAAKEMGLVVKAGNQATYRVVMDTDMLIKATLPPGTKSDMPSEIQTTQHIEFDAVLKVEALEKTTATLSYEMKNLAAESTVLGRKIPLEGAMPASFKVTVKLDVTTGEVLEVTGLPEMKGTEGLNGGQFKEMLKQTFLQLPKNGKAKVGDVWEMTMPDMMSLPGIQNNSRLTMSAKYGANVKLDGKDMALILVTAKGPLELSMDQKGVKVLLKGEITSEGVNYADRSTGWLHSSTGTAKGSMTTTAEQGGKKMVMEIALDSRMQVNRK